MSASADDLAVMSKGAKRATLKATAGPWSVWAGDIYPPHKQIVAIVRTPAGGLARDALIVSSHDVASFEVRPNANVVAASIELLEALKTTAANIRSLGPAGALDQVPMPYREWLAVVDAAIATAEAGNG